MSEESSELDPTVEKGRRLVVAIAVSLIGSIVLLAALGMTGLREVPIQLAVTGLVLFQVFRGRSWARWVLVALTGLAAVGTFGQLASSGQFPPVPLALAAVYAACALALTFSPAIARFLEARQRAEG